MKALIKIEDLNVFYGNNHVIKNFNYYFSPTGFYSIVGPSGSGKTTLINTMLGLLEFKGTISINGNIYKDVVPNSDIEGLIGYITQDTYFIEYLSVMDNLMLIESNSIKIKKIAKKIGISNILTNYPNEISGGERQRVAIAQCLLKNKKIIILDEPTSSLDFKNKIDILELLKQLSKDRLIICSTHDSIIKEYTNNIINIEKKYNFDMNALELVSFQFKDFTHKNDIISYIFKQRKYKKREKISDVIITIIFIFCLLVSFICTSNEEKIFNSMVKMYKVNYLTVTCNNKEYCLNDFYKNNIKHYSYSYHKNVPNPPEDIPDGGTWDINYDATLKTLPYDEKLFPYSEEILYGNYFEDENSVILGYDAAKQYSDDVETLVGKELELNLYGTKDTFKIVGIFNSFSNDALMYLQCGENVDSHNEEIYINDRYTERYILNHEGSITFFIYFDKVNDLINYYNEFDEYKKVDNISSNFVEHKILLESLAIYLYPGIVICIITSILFYFQIKLIELKYKEYIFGVYCHYGYELSKIKKGYFIYMLYDVVYKYFIAVLSSLIISKVIDILNNYFKLFDYQLFSINICYIFVMFCILIFMSLLINFIYFINLKSNGWYEIVKRERDIL